MGVDIGINLRLAAALFALSVTGSSDIALADWEFTKWGMTLEEVRNASPIELIQVSQEVQIQSRTFANDGNSEILAAVNWTYMDQSCSAFFYFDVKSKKLVSVLQQFRTVKVADQLLYELTKKYGEPTKKSELMPDLFTRTWTTPDDEIVFLRQGDTAQVNYFERYKRCSVIRSERCGEEMPTVLLFIVTAVVEAATGLTLMIWPQIVASMLFGAELAGAGILVARIAGMALVSLAFACWISRRNVDMAATLAAMLSYNLLVAAYLIYLGLDGEQTGPLLWPAAALHAVLSILFARVYFRNRRLS